MKRIKIIDVPHYETDPKVIGEHLTEFLKKYRKDKVAADLIGSDERSVEFGVKDFDMFGDDLSDGVELTFEDIRRINAHSSKLAKDRVAAAGVSHLKREEYDRFEPSLTGMQVIMAKAGLTKLLLSCMTTCPGWVGQQNMHGMPCVALHNAGSPS